MFLGVGVGLGVHLMVTCVVSNKPLIHASEGTMHETQREGVFSLIPRPSHVFQCVRERSGRYYCDVMITCICHHFCRGLNDRLAARTVDGYPLLRCWVSSDEVMVAMNCMG